MQKIRNKIITTLTIVALLMVQFAPTLVYASAEIKSNATNQENVKFDATISNGYSAVFDIEGEATLDLAISVENVGYLKDCKITLEGNNYQIAKPDNKYVKSVANNTVELNEIKTGEIAEISIPIKAVKENVISTEYFAKDSTVTLSAIYVNEKGKEKEVKKTITERVEWKANAELEISQQLVRYLKYDQNKTMLSFEITDGIKNNVLPALNKQISIVVPNIENKQPSKVIVTGNNVKYNYEKGNLVIQKENVANDEGKIAWNSNDTYMVTYIYDVQTTSEKVLTTAEEKVTLVNEIEQTAKTTENEFSITAEVGNIVSIETTNEKELSKGYMYTNLNNTDSKLDTTYSTIYDINVGYAELTDEIILTEESNSIISDKNKEIDISQNISDKKVSAVLSEIEEILGDEGTITVKDTNGTELGKITKDNLELSVNTSKVILEISKPQKEGDIHIKIDKAIGGNTNYTRAQINAFTTLTSKVTVSGLKDDTEISKGEKISTITLKEPTSKASIDVSTKTLTTVVENQDVVFNVVLSKKDITDALFTNPKFKIELPNQVTGIKVTAAQILYDDELKAGNAEINGRELDVSLLGTQTKYEKSTTVDGTLIRIVADITLNNLEPSSKEKIKLTYTNEATGETNVSEADIDIVAPSGFITTNRIDIDGKSVTALEKEPESIKIEIGSAEKEMNISATIINNLGTEAKGATVLGRLPFAGNKNLQGKTLNSTFNTTITKPVTVNGLNATVYYSENGDEKIDGSSWTTQYSANTKSFKIVINENMEDKTSATFGYSVIVPENLPYEMTAKEIYGVYYDNDSTSGTTRNLIQAMPVGITTGAIPTLNIDTTIVDTHDGHTIGNNGNVTEGEYITYKINVQNTGNQTATNVKVLVTLPSGINLVEKEAKTSMNPYGGYIINRSTKQIVKEINEIKAKETSTIEIPAIVSQTVSDDEENSKLVTSIKATADNVQENPARTFTVKNTNGNVSLKLMTNAKSTVEQWEEVDFQVQLSKVNIEDKDNVKIQLHLPSEMDYVGIAYQSSYDEANHILTIDYGTLDKSFDTIWIPTQLLGSKTGNITAVATVTCDGQTGETRSNTVSINSVALEDVLTANQSVNVPNGRITDTDKLELYLDIKNNSNSLQLVNIEDTVPSSLNVSKVSLTVDGKVLYEGETNYIMNSVQIPSGKAARMTISAVLSNEASGVMNNTPKITAGDTEIKVNEINLNIENKANNSNEEATTKAQETLKEEQNNTSNATEETRVNSTYTISGIVWFDKNNDGKRDYEEEKLEKVNLLLFDANTSKVAKDYAGKEITASTDEAGRYSFENLNPGKYIVVAVYDNSEYAIGSYRVEGVSDSENSDFISAKLNNEEVAATDTIQVIDSNTYNIDLGLRTKKEFDLSLDQVVSKITVTNTKADTETTEYNSDVVKVELSPRNIEYTTVLVEYKISITNEGQLPGYATSIVDYLPEGMIFSSELNSDWYMSVDGNVYNTSLANTVINPGETKEVILILMRRMTGENTGIVRNTAEIKSSYTEYGVEDIDSKAGNEQVGEDDMSSTDAVILMNAGREMATISGITVGILALTALAIYEIQKHIINKMYNYVS